MRVVSGARGALKIVGARSSIRRQGQGAAADRGPLPHVRGRAQAHQLISITGIAGIGKFRLAWEFYKYFDGLPRDHVLAPGALSLVRRRCNILGARGHGSYARAHHGGRGAPRAHSQKLADIVEEHLPDESERPLRRATAPPSHRARGRPVSNARTCSPTWRLFFERLADVYPDGHGLRGHAVGRRVAARLHRVPARVVASPPRSSSSRSLAPNCRRSAPVGASATRNYTSIFLEPLSKSAMGRSPRRARAWASARADDADTRPRRGHPAVRRRDGAHAPRPRGARAGGLRLPADRHDRGAGGAGDAARAHRRSSRRTERQRNVASSRTGRCSARRSRAQSVAPLSGSPKRSSSHSSRR